MFQYLFQKFFKKNKKNIRKSIKTFEKRYGKIKKSILNTDKEQDEEYKKDLRFSFLKRFFIYKNLGIYFTDNKKVILNTHLCIKYFNLNSYNFKNKEKVYQLGMNLSSIIESV